MSNLSYPHVKKHGPCECSAHTLVTVICTCGTEKTFALGRLAVANWDSGTLAQVAFPSLSPNEREQLISGTCPPCFDRPFPVEEGGES